MTKKERIPRKYKIILFKVKSLFTYEPEKDKRVSFLDVSIWRLTNGKLETKHGCINELELSCTYAVENRHIKKVNKKISTLIGSDQHLLQKEVDYLRKLFVKVNRLRHLKT